MCMCVCVCVYVYGYVCVYVCCVGFIRCVQEERPDVIVSVHPILQVCQCPLVVLFWLFVVFFWLFVGLFWLLVGFCWRLSGLFWLLVGLFCDTVKVEFLFVFFFTRMCSVAPHATVSAARDFDPRHQRTSRALRNGRHGPGGGSSVVV
jgi:hypothetical protein